MDQSHIQKVYLKVLTMTVGDIDYKNDGAIFNNSAIVCENEGNFKFEIDDTTANKLQVGDDIGLVIISTRERKQLPIVSFLVKDPEGASEILVGKHDYFKKFYAIHSERKKCFFNFF